MSLTPNLGLKTIDRAQEATTKYVSDWIDDVNGNEDSNATIIDKAFGELQEDLSTKAPLDSPSLTGEPTAPTPSLDGDKNRIATLESLTNAIDNIPTPDVSGQIAEHNKSDTAHEDIRELID